MASFRATRAAVSAIARDESKDLYTKIPHSTANWLAQILLIADHNTYHLGQLVLLRRMLAE